MVTGVFSSLCRIITHMGSPTVKASMTMANGTFNRIQLMACGDAFGWSYDAVHLLGTTVGANS